MLTKIKWTVGTAVLMCFVIWQIATAENPWATPKVEPQRYTAYGRYYTDGTIITNDGNAWDYTISDRSTYDTMPIWIGFDDNGTPNDITDDVVLGAVFDRNTAIYDELETKLSEKFELTRDGNNIRIKTGD